VTGATLLEVSESFWARQTVWRRWLPVITSSAALWFGITLLALVAALKRRRARTALARSDAGEEALPPPGREIAESTRSDPPVG
jgi:hypothetical protein